MEKIIHHIRKVRRQPEEVRRHILHVATIVFAVILIALWFYSLGTNLVNPESDTRAENALKPFSALKANIVGGYKSISNPNEDMLEY